MSDSTVATWAELLDVIAFNPGIGPRARGFIRPQNAWGEIRRRLLRYGVLEMSRQSLTSMADLEEIVDDLLLRLTDARFLAKSREVLGHAGFFRLIIRRRLIDRAREERREHQARVEAAREFESQPPRSAPETETTLRNAELKATLRQLLIGISEEDRQMLVMRFLEMLSFREIAGELGMRPGTVAVRLHRLLRRLRSSAEEAPGP